MVTATSENNQATQDANNSLHVHLKRVRELFDQYESVDVGSGSKKTRRERLMADMDHE